MCINNAVPPSSASGHMNKRHSRVTPAEVRLNKLKYRMCKNVGRKVSAYSFKRSPYLPPYQDVPCICIHGGVGPPH